MTKTKAYKKLHNDPKAAKKHIDKIVEKGGFLKKTKQGDNLVLEYSFPSKNTWFHGSSRVLKEILPFEKLKMPYKGEDGAWFTSNFLQAKFYGTNVTKWDTSKLKILDKSKMTKQEFVLDFWVKRGYKKEDIIRSMSLDDEFKDIYDAAYLYAVDEKGYDAVKLRGEFKRGFDLWVAGIGSLKKMTLIVD